MTSTLITWQEYFCCVLVAIGAVTEDGGKQTTVFSFCSLSSKSDLLIINGVNPNAYLYFIFLRGVSNLTTFLLAGGSLYEGKVHVNFSLILNLQFAFPFYRSSECLKGLKVLLQCWRCLCKQAQQRFTEFAYSPIHHLLALLV